MCRNNFKRVKKYLPTAYDINLKIQIDGLKFFAKIENQNMPKVKIDYERIYKMITL